MSKITLLVLFCTTRLINSQETMPASRERRFDILSKSNTIYVNILTVMFFSIFLKNQIIKDLLGYH